MNSFAPDQDQRNIIDKLANFVARNGPQFEELTKEKQRSNAKFQFLYGGEYHAYYKWKVHLEGISKRQTVFASLHKQDRVSLSHLIALLNDD